MVQDGEGNKNDDSVKGERRGTITGRRLCLQRAMSTFLLEFHLSGGVKDSVLYYLSRLLVEYRERRIKSPPLMYCSGHCSFIFDSIEKTVAEDDYMNYSIFIFTYDSLESFS